MNLRLIALSLFFLHFSTYASLRLATFNIRNFDKESSKERSLRERTDKERLSELIRETNADVLAVQEIFDEESFHQFVSEYLEGYEVILTRCGGSGKQKLGFLYRKSNISLQSSFEEASIALGEECHVGLRPALVAKFKSLKTKLLFHAISVHLKAGDLKEDEEKRQLQLEQLETLTKRLTLKGEQHLVIMGDFNTTGFVAKNDEYQAFLKFTGNIKSYSYSQKLKCTSYWKVDKKQDLYKGSLLDHIIISDSLTAKFKTKKIDVLSHCKVSACSDSAEDELGLTFENVSDHCPVVSELK